MLKILEGLEAPLPNSSSAALAAPHIHSLFTPFGHNHEHDMEDYFDQNPEIHANTLAILSEANPLPFLGEHFRGFLSGMSTLDVPAYSTFWSDICTEGSTLDANDNPTTSSLAQSLPEQAVATATTPSRRERNQRKHACRICDKLFDRPSRARDHAYKDLEEKPYSCGGECATNTWYAYFQLECQLLYSHIAVSLRLGRKYS